MNYERMTREFKSYPWYLKLITKWRIRHRIKKYINIFKTKIGLSNEGDYEYIAREIYKWEKLLGIFEKL